MVQHSERTSTVRGTAFLLAAVGIVLVTINLRPPITALGPLLGQVRADTGMSGTVASLLTSLPLLVFVVFSPLAPRIGARFGLERTLGAALLLLIAGFAVRSLPSTVALFAGTVLLGIAITAGNVLMPAWIKQRHSPRSGTMTGLYTASLNLGPAAAAGLTIPLQQATGLGWRATLALWAILAVAGLLAWLPQLRRNTGEAPKARPQSTPKLWHLPLAWAVTLFFALLSLLFYTISAWLPTLFADAGMDRATAGGMVSVISIVGIPFALLAPILAARTKGQVWLTTLGTGLLAAGLLGVLLSPAHGTLAWMVILGAGQGVTTGICFALLLLRSPDTRHAAALAAMTQTVGYVLAALGPIAFGALHDATRAWTVPVLLLLVLVGVQCASGFLAGRDRLVGERAQR
ncbi:CynX/NimT family MFS transporter [Sciscionella sediminilitoris]|uniref:CynX/NimT family MFS transporter n=1 Tax=Sciscionella sediminilitoris TaxID=1445613 RepID=UPI000AA0F65D|nr:MFS transporter [Sciscionella sp. SE31]